jgi:hypothetical protein
MDSFGLRPPSRKGGATMNKSLMFYLKWINPAVAVLILLICCWIYFGGYFVEFSEKQSPFQKGELIIDPSEMGFSMYFFAKGLFCSSALFMLGEFLKRYLRASRDPLQPPDRP